MTKCLQRWRERVDFNVYIINDILNIIPYVETSTSIEIGALGYPVTMVESFPD